MKKVYVLADAIVSPLGYNSSENFNALLQDKTGLQPVDIYPENYTTFASVLNKSQISFLAGNDFLISRFEKLLYTSILQVEARKKIDFSSPKTIFIFATTKGNIELINVPGIAYEKLNLYYSAQKISKLFENPNKPIVISNACISGSAAIILGSRLIRAGFYKHAVICGADTVNDFVLSGFQSLKALSIDHCRPFDKNRSGVNLGEAAACIVLSSVESNFKDDFEICISGGAISNDANHISGPSRTGQELALAIQKTLKESGIIPEMVDYVSAHGTATDYNDEMESKALGICNLTQTPTNSLKACFGHTLGVAGLLESIICVHSLSNNTIVKSKGFEECGTSQALNITKSHVKKPLNIALKTIAGFGGCNAALIIKKENS